MNIKTKFNIVLYEPEIPQNTGNIVRLAACTNADVYLVGKLGFSIDSHHLKRAGLDYWDSVNIKRVEKLEDLYEEFPDRDFYYLITYSGFAGLLRQARAALRQPSPYMGSTP